MRTPVRSSTSIEVSALYANNCRTVIKGIYGLLLSDYYVMLLIITSELYEKRHFRCQSIMMTSNDDERNGSTAILLCRNVFFFSSSRFLSTLSSSSSSLSSLLGYFGRQKFCFFRFFFYEIHLLVVFEAMDNWVMLIFQGDRWLSGTRSNTHWTFFINFVLWQHVDLSTDKASSIWMHNCVRTRMSSMRMCVVEKSSIRTFFKVKKIQLFA